MFSVKKLSGCIGAELSGVDLTSDLDKSVLDEIEKLLLEHEVIFFRDLEGYSKDDVLITSSSELADEWAERISILIKSLEGDTMNGTAERT